MNDTDDVASKLRTLEEKNAQLDRDAKIILQHDIQIREAYDQLDKEKETISAEKNKLSIILQGITDAVIAVDLDSKVITFNKAAEELLEISADEVMDKPISEIVRLANGNQQLEPSTFCPIQRDTFEGVLFQKSDLTLTTKSGQKYVDVITGKIKEGLRVGLGCIITFHDVSKEQELESMKLDFVSMAAHELRTPITTIRGYISLYLDYYKKEMNEEQKTYLDRINNATTQLITLVENILNVSHIERGTLEVKPEEIDWPELVKQTVNEGIDRAQEKQITLNLDSTPDGLPHALADKTMIKEVLTNLINNAIAYTNSGGSVTVSFERKDNEIITHVKDTGEGIPKDALSHLFTKFYRVAGPLQQGSKGTGLGLFISKEIVKLHKGRIWVESEVNQGSTFSFSLPVANNG